MGVAVDPSLTLQNRLYLNGNQLQRLPSAMTRLTNLETCVFVVAFCWLVLIALCRLWLSGNAALPVELQQNMFSRDSTQALLQRIGAHYGGEHVLGLLHALKNALIPIKKQLINTAAMPLCA